MTRGMSLQGAYTLGFGLAIATSLLSVLLSDQLPDLMWAMMAAPLASAFLRGRARALHGAVGTVIAGAGLLGGASWVLQRGLAVSVHAGTVALMAILLGRLMTRETLRHDAQCLLVSLLLVFAGAVLTVQITYAIVFAGYAIAMVWALVTRELMSGAQRESKRSDSIPFEEAVLRQDIVTPVFAMVLTGLSVVILLSTSVLFLLFPRIGFYNFAILARSGGKFPSHVSLVDRPRGNGGSAAIVRVRGVERDVVAAGLYLRGPVYDRWTPDGFRRSEPSARLRVDRPDPGLFSDDHTYEVFMPPLMGQVLLTLGPVRGAFVLSGGGSNPSRPISIFGYGAAGELLASQPLSGPLRYLVRGSIASRAQAGSRGTEGENSGAIDERAGGADPKYLAAPDAVDPRVTDLARTVTRGISNGAEKVEVLTRFLRSNFQYSLESTNGSRSDPLAGFLFEDRRGHCEYFATALAALLRVTGVPTRVIGGFYGGRWDEPGKVVVFAGEHAHAWIEWFDSRRGWITEDATPSSSTPLQNLSGWLAWREKLQRWWDDHVIDYGLEQQVTLAGLTWRRLPRPSWNRRWWVGLSVMVLLLGFAWVARNRRHRYRRVVSVDPLGQSIVEAAERLAGQRIQASCTVREAVAQVAGDATNDHSVLRRSLRAYEASRFGRTPMSRIDRRRWRRRLAELKARG